MPAEFSLPSDTLAPLAVLAVAVVIGLLCATRRRDAFELADRAVPPFINGLATSPAFLTAAPFAGLAGALFALGSDGLGWLVGLAAGLVLMGTLIAPAFRASGAATIAEFLGQRFASPVVRTTAALLVAVVCLPLLVAQFTTVAELAQPLMGVSPVIAVSASALAVVAILVPGGLRGATAAGAVLGIVVLVAACGPLAKLAAETNGVGLGHIAYGHSLQELQRLERELIVNGLADARSLKPHLRPFLQVDVVNTLALILTLMAGAAALPHVLMRQGATRSVGATRMGMAWTLLISAAVLAAVPAYAALSKHKIYDTIARGVALGDLGPEIMAYSRDDLVRVHGVSLKLMDDVATAIAEGAADAAAVTARLSRAVGASGEAWSALKPQVHGALIEAAGTSAGLSLEQRWQTLRGSVLPTAAIADGNKSGKLTLGGLNVAAAAVVPLALTLAGVSPIWSTVFAAGAMAAALVAAAALTFAIGQALTRDVGARGRGERQPVAPRLAVTGVAATAAAIALVLRGEAVGLTAATVSLAAAGLFPVLVLAVWWRRMTAAGAMAGMLTGLLVSAVYLAGTQFMPVRLYEATSGLSNASGTAVKRLGELKAAAETAPEAARSAALAARDAHARGTEVTPGVANWFGVHRRAAGIFGLPVGIATILLVSLLTRRPKDDVLRFADGLRRPGAMPAE